MATPNFLGGHLIYKLIWQFQAGEFMTHGRQFVLCEVEVCDTTEDAKN